MVLHCTAGSAGRKYAGVEGMDSIDGSSGGLNERLVL
jgi:hypothetical protein